MKEVMAALVTVNTVALLAVPPEVVTVIVPLLAPSGTVALMVLAFSTDIVVAAVPLNFTAVAPVKFVPERVTICPISPLVGVKDVMVGAGTGKTKAHRNPVKTPLPRNAPRKMSPEALSHDPPRITW